jgi:hypothetical protein
MTPKRIGLIVAEKIAAADLMGLAEVFSRAKLARSLFVRQPGRRGDTSPTLQRRNTQSDLAILNRHRRPPLLAAMAQFGRIILLPPEA